MTPLLLRVWSFPELSKVHEFTTHEKEIDDVDFSPDSARICSISKDRYKAIVLPLGIWFPFIVNPAPPEFSLVSYLLVLILVVSSFMAPSGPLKGHPGSLFALV